MSKTDIYKNREPIPTGGKAPKKNHERRRRSRDRAFDDRSHLKRRSKNSGFRRFLHLFRKSDNEKCFWVSFAVVLVVLLMLAAIWQYLVVEKVLHPVEEPVASATE